MVKPIYIAIMLIALSIGGISGSSYGLGLSNKNKASTEYIVSTVMLSISLFIFVTSMISLVIIASPSVLNNASSALQPMDTVQLTPTVPIIQQPSYTQYDPRQFFGY